MTGAAGIVHAVAAAALAFPAPAAAATQQGGDVGASAAAVPTIGHSAGGSAPGCVAGAYRDGRPLLTRAEGYADLMSRRPLSDRTIFYAASLSKQFTALTIATIAEQGLIDLDADIRRYLPELPDYGAAITARMLLQHSSGVRDWLNLASLSGRSSGELSKDEALALVLKQSALNFRPGSRVLYSNGGYLLLAEIVERVTRTPFADYAKARLLAPLGMRESFFLSGARPKGQAFAHGYVQRQGSFRMRDNYPRISGSGGLMTSLNDLAAYERAWTNDHPLLTPFVRKVLTTPGMLEGGQPAIDGKKGTVYAAGLAIGFFHGLPVIRHGGSADGFNHLYVRFPETEEAIVLLCNYAGGADEAKLEAIFDAVLASSGPEPYVLAPGETRYYFSRDLQRHFRVDAVEKKALLLSICDQDLTCSTPERFRLQSQGRYSIGRRSIRFTNGGVQMLLSASRAFDVSATQVKAGAK